MGTTLQSLIKDSGGFGGFDRTQEIIRCIGSTVLATLACTKSEATINSIGHEVVTDGAQIASNRSNDGGDIDDGDDDSDNEDDTNDSVSCFVMRFLRKLAGYYHAGQCDYN